MVHSCNLYIRELNTNLPYCRIILLGHTFSTVEFDLALQVWDMVKGMKHLSCRVNSRSWWVAWTSCQAQSRSLQMGKQKRWRPPSSLAVPWGPFIWVMRCQIFSFKASYCGDLRILLLCLWWILASLQKISTSPYEHMQLYCAKMGERNPWAKKNDRFPSSVMMETYWSHVFFSTKDLVHTSRNFRHCKCFSTKDLVHTSRNFRHCKCQIWAWLHTGANHSGSLVSSALQACQGCSWGYGKSSRVHFAVIVHGLPFSGT